MHTCLYSEQNEEVIDLIRRLMCTNQPPLTQRLIYALKGLYPPEIVEYLLGVYYLEFAKAYVLGGGRYIETKVSFRRARRHLKRALRQSAGRGNSDGDWRILRQGAAAAAGIRLL